MLIYYSSSRGRGLSVQIWIRSKQAVSFFFCLEVMIYTYKRKILMPQNKWRIIEQNYGMKVSVSEEAFLKTKQMTGIVIFFFL